MRESRSPPPFNEEPQISKDFWGFFVFLPADLFLLRCFFFSLNISLSRRFRRWRRFFLIDYLSPTDFTDLHRFFLLIILVPQISRIPTDFFHRLFFSWIYTDFLWFSSFPAISSFSLSFLLFPVISSFSCHFFISQILDLSVWEDDADFWFHELERDYADFSNSLFFLFWIHWFLYIINLLIRQFSDPYFFTSFVLFPYFFTSFFL